MAIGKAAKAGAKALKTAGMKLDNAGRKTKAATMAGKKAGTVARKKKQKTAAEMGSRPVQERDTGPGGMTATGSKKRLGKAVGKNQKKYGTRVGTGSVSARKPSGKK